jgi:hypothetical protein
MSSPEVCEGGWVMGMVAASLHGFLLALWATRHDFFLFHTTALHSRMHLHNHAELQLVFTNNAILLRLELVHIPFAVDESSRRPWSWLF